jgi:hypothetical protein
VVVAVGCQPCFGCLHSYVGGEGGRVGRREAPPRAGGHLPSWCLLRSLLEGCPSCCTLCSLAHLCLLHLVVWGRVCVSLLLPKLMLRLVHIVLLLVLLVLHLRWLQGADLLGVLSLCPATPPIFGLAVILMHG